MKKVLVGLFITAGMGFGMAQTISFDQTTIEYGNIVYGSDGQRVVTVTNTGDQPLIISNVKPSCGCTTPVWSDAPIQPGDSAKITVGYNTKLKGPFKKLIEVYSNDPESQRKIIWIKGVVTPPPPQETPAP